MLLLNKCFVDRVDNPLTPIGSNSTQENPPRNSPYFASSPARLGWPARSRHACIDFFTYSDDHWSRQSGLCPIRVGSGRLWAGEDKCWPTDQFQRVWNGCGRKRVKATDSSFVSGVVVCCRCHRESRPPEGGGSYLSNPTWWDCSGQNGGSGSNAFRHHIVYSEVPGAPSTRDTGNENDSSCAGFLTWHVILI